MAVAHGTRDPAGPQVIAELMAGVGRRLPGVEVITAWVELVAPGYDEVMSAMDRPSVVVPLLLSTGHHVTSDIPAGAVLSASAVHVAPPLGPHPLLAGATAARLRKAGARPGDAVVLAAAGSSDPAGLADVARAAALLSAEWGPRVSHAVLSASGPDLPGAIERHHARGARRVCVAPYLLAPGRFSRQLEEEAVAAGAATVAPVLGSHRYLVDLVVLRYLQGLEAQAVTPYRAA